MARRYKRRIDWHWLRSKTETSLNESGKFPVPVSVDRKMEWIESGLYHDNYRFRIGGMGLGKELKEKPFLNWLWNSAERHRKGKTSGHGPDYYLQRLKSLLHRAEKCY